LQADEDLPRLRALAGEGEAARQHRLQERVPAGELRGLAMLPDRLAVAAEALEGEAHGPTAQEVVRVQLHGLAGVVQLPRVVAREVGLEREERRRHERERVELL